MRFATLFRVAVIAAVLVCASVTQAGFAIFQVASNAEAPADVVCTITTGNCTGTGGGTGLFTAATCDGNPAHDDGPAFASFNTWITGTWQVAHPGLLAQLNIPSGASCQFIATTQANEKWTFGIKRLRVMGYGATLDSTGGSAFFFLGGLGVCDIGIASASGCSARLQAVSAGAASVTLTSASLSSGYISRFSVGSYVIIGGLNTQTNTTPGNYPPNLHFWNIAKITAINVGTGVITLDRPAVYDLKTTWPIYNEGDGGHNDPGGPATIWALDSTWDAEFDYRGLTISQTAQTNAVGRSVTFRDVTFTGTDCWSPSQNETATIINSDLSSCNNSEPDKLVWTLNIQGTNWRKMTFQSSSIEYLNVSNSTITFLTGTPKRTTISNSSMTTLKIGPQTNGVAVSFNCDTCTATTFVVGGFTDQPISPTMSGGVITIANSAGAWLLAVPGGTYFWQGSAGIATSFYITDITQDASNTYYHTNLAGGFPTIAGLAPNYTVQTHPAPSFTCTNCSGSPDMVDFSGAPAGIPIYSYSSRTYNGDDYDPPGPTMWGYITSLTVNTTTAYTGARPSPTFTPFAVCNSWVAQDYSTATWCPFANIKNPGGTPHTIAITCATLGSCSVTGNQTGDSGLSLPSNQSVWLTGGANSTPIYDDPATAPGCLGPPNVCAIITVTVQTNQQLPFLLKRDLDPAANDNSPMWLNKVA